MNQVASITAQLAAPECALPETDVLSTGLPILDEAHAVLQANSGSYQHLLKRISGSNSPISVEETLKRVSAAAAFACRFHPGRFSDGALENLLLEVGRTAQAGAPQRSHPRPPEQPLRVLHVATAAIAVGGHTRMMQRWITADRGNRHSVALTNQGQADIPPWLVDSVVASGGRMLSFEPLAAERERATRLADEANESADLVVVHHAGADVVPTLAFAKAGGPPVAILNHADHAFWLGSSVADLCIDLRSVTNAYSVARRHIPKTAVLPIPLPAPVEPIDRQAARLELGIAPDTVMLLTVARAIKFRPCGGYDFMNTIETVLAENPKLLLCVVGETAQGMVQQLGRPLHPRIQCVGPIENPARYRAASDVYIETFPFGSNTSLLEAALDGVPVVPACRPLSNLLIAWNDSLVGTLTNPVDEAEYCDRIRAFANDPALRLRFGRELREALLSHHVGEAWRAHLESIYRTARTLVHAPRRIPVTACETTPCDIGLALFTAMSNRRPGSRSGLLTELAALRHSAYVAKYVRDFRVARSASFAALRHDVFGPETWRLFVVSVLGPFARGAGDLVRRIKGAA